MPTGPAADLELALRHNADPLAVSDLDRAMRTLAHTTAPHVPRLRAARITDQTLELYLVDTDTDYRESVTR